jgi:hypothetical protein
LESAESKSVESSADSLVGKEISVWWEKYNRHYSGKVIPTDDPGKGSHIVRYDDGQDVYEDLVGANAAKFEVIENGDDVSYDGVDQDEGAVSYFMSSHPEIHMFYDLLHYI